MQFRALTDLYLNDGRYISAGQVFDAPVNLDQTGWQYVINFTPTVNAVLRNFINWMKLRLCEKYGVSIGADMTAPRVHIALARQY